MQVKVWTQMQVQEQVQVQVQVWEQVHVQEQVQVQVNAKVLFWLLQGVLLKSTPLNWQSVRPNSETRGRFKRNTL